jgi:hypothetical protein
MTAPHPQDTPTHRLSVAELSDEDLDKLLLVKREARMMAQVIYERALATRMRAKEDKLRDTIDKKLKQFEKSIESADKAIDRMWRLCNEVRALRLQLSGEVDVDVPVERPGARGTAEGERPEGEASSEDTA